MKKDQGKILNIILPIISVSLIFIVWAITAIAVDNAYLLPSVSQTLKEFFSLFTYSEFYLALGGTLLRSLIAFLISFSISCVLAFLSYNSDKAKRFISPIIAITRVLPTIAVVLLLLVWTNSFVAPVVVTMLVVLPTIYTNVLNSLEGIDKGQIEMCKLFGISEKEITLKVKLPQIAPPLYSTIGSGISLNLKLMVAAEVLSFTVNSIGYYLQTAKQYDQLVTMMALVLVTVILGLIIEGVFSLISKKVGKWQ